MYFLDPEMRRRSLLPPDSTIWGPAGFSDRDARDAEEVEAEDRALTGLAGVEVEDMGVRLEEADEAEEQQGDEDDEQEAPPERPDPYTAPLLNFLPMASPSGLIELAQPNGRGAGPVGAASPPPGQAEIDALLAYSEPDPIDEEEQEAMRKSAAPLLFLLAQKAKQQGRLDSGLPAE